MPQQNFFHRFIVLAGYVVCRFLARESNRYSECRRNFFCKNFDVLARIDGDILERRFVEVTRKSLLRDYKFSTRKDFDVGKIFYAQADEFNPVGEGKFAFVLLHDEEIKFGDAR